MKIIYKPCIKNLLFKLIHGGYMPKVEFDTSLYKIGLYLNNTMIQIVQANNNPVFTGENSVEIVRGATVPNWSTFVLVDDKQDGAIIVTDEMIDLGGFNVNVPGEYKVTYTVEDTDGNSETFVVNVTVTGLVNGNNDITLEFVNPNGSADESPLDNAVTHSINAILDGVLVEILIHTDNYAEETTWTLED